MSAYQIIYSDIVLKSHISKLPASAKKLIKRAIDSRLTQDPINLGKPLKHSLKGYRRLRVADYRVIYRIEPDERAVYIIAIGHRKDIYE